MSHEDRYNRERAFLARRMLDVAAYLETSESPDKVSKASNELRRTFDRSTSSCLSSCKWMYFCTLPMGHEGHHSEDGGLIWTEEEADNPVPEN